MNGISLIPLATQLDVADILSIFQEEHKAAFNGINQ